VREKNFEKFYFSKLGFVLFGQKASRNFDLRNRTMPKKGLKIFGHDPRENSRVLPCGGVADKFSRRVHRGAAGRGKY